MARFSVIALVDNRMVCESSIPKNEMLKELSWRGIQQLHVFAIWAPHARRGDVFCDGNVAVLCTSGRREICMGVLDAALVLSGENHE